MRRTLARLALPLAACVLVVAGCSSSGGSVAASSSVATMGPSVAATPEPSPTSTDVPAIPSASVLPPVSGYTGLCKEVRIISDKYFQTVQEWDFEQIASEFEDNALPLANDEERVHVEAVIHVLRDEQGSPEQPVLLVQELTPLMEICMNKGMPIV